MKPRARFKTAPEDFVVDEIDAYDPSGEGGHTFVRIRKRALTTDVAVGRLARALRVDPRACGWAGMKDKDAIATQRVSLPNVDPEAALAAQIEGVEVIEAKRHGQKLKPGHLRGNRFLIRLRAIERSPGHRPEPRSDSFGEPSESSIDDVIAHLERIGREGTPNAFGPQRFGRDGDNPSRALAFVRGEEPAPRDPRQRRFLFSALQSRWFNRVLEARVADGTWRVPQLGDLLKKHTTGGMFLCEDVEADRARALAGEVSPTGPIFGAKMSRPGEAIDAREREILREDGIDEAHLQAQRALGEGTRRSLRLLVEGLAARREGDDLVVSMTLPKGAYATTVLGEVVTLVGPGARDDDVTDEEG